MFEEIDYRDLNSRQKENYNFQKVAARLANYGFNCLRLTDDWQGADFIACHIDGETVLKVQLKSRLTIDKKYVGKAIYIAFLNHADCFLYPHDAFLNALIERGSLTETSRLWDEEGRRSWPRPPVWATQLLQQYKV
ncbi:MAG: hypothetical protein WBB85_22875 [Albidovulum sp.]|uniref:hypothetical protein n=1 Tax=Albidovulum sp. TaxID=1872424 RepID=UPI003C832776